MANGDWGVEIPGGYFDEKFHRYRNTKGTIIPSTTQVFSILGCNDFDGVPADVLEWKRNYGRAVHKAIEFLVAGDLDWDSLDEMHHPGRKRLEQKLKAIQFKYEAAEEMRIHILRDGVWVDGRSSGNHRSSGARASKVVIDLKSGVKFSPTWRWQLGGYTVPRIRLTAVGWG